MMSNSLDQLDTMLPDMDRRKTAQCLMPVLALFLFVLCLAGVAAQAPKIDTSRIGPQVGQRAPDFSGTDQFGRKHTLASSLGAKGALLVFFRSADW
jgi:hypothetical protein